MMSKAWPHPFGRWFINKSWKCTFSFPATPKFSSKKCYVLLVARRNTEKGPSTFSLHILSFFTLVSSTFNFLKPAFGDTTGGAVHRVRSACIETDTQVHPAPLPDYLPFELVHAGIWIWFWVNRCRSLGQCTHSGTLWGQRARHSDTRPAQRHQKTDYRIFADYEYLQIMNDMLSPKVYGWKSSCIERYERFCATLCTLCQNEQKGQGNKKTWPQRIWEQRRFVRPHSYCVLNVSSMSGTQF